MTYVVDLGGNVDLTTADVDWTEVGAKQVGIIQSLLTTCRLHDVDPYAYLVDVLQRVALHPAREVGQLTPRCWKALYADSPLRSDLDHAR